MSKNSKDLKDLYKSKNYIGEVKEIVKGTEEILSEAEALLKPLEVKIEKGQLATLEAIYWNDRKNSSNNDIYENVEDFIIGEIIPRGIEHFTNELNEQDLQDIILEAYAR